MIIKTITHNTKNKQRKGDLSQQSFIKDPKFHPFFKEREYMRALNATKIERLLAKPFIKGFSEHKDGITRVNRHKSCDLFLSTSFNGEVHIYDLDGLKHMKTDNMPGSATFFNDDVLITDKKDVNIYDSHLKILKGSVTATGFINYISSYEDILCSTSSGLEIYDTERKSYKQKYGCNSYDFATYSKDGNVIAGASENKLIIIDNRAECLVSENCVGFKTNFTAFSPDGRLIITANEDTNSYLHDLRFMDSPMGTFRHHVNAVTCVDWSPDGSEFVSGSFDKTLRIFKVNERRSRDVYYNRRMHNINGVVYSVDGTKIISGSDDGSMRVWRSHASSKECTSKKEKDALIYAEKLKNKFKDVDEIKRISKHRFLPKNIKGEMKNRHEHHLGVERRNQKVQKWYEENKGKD